MKWIESKKDVILHLTHTDDNNTGICDIFKDGGCLDYEELYLRKQKETKKGRKTEVLPRSRLPSVALPVPPRARLEVGA